MEFIVSASCPGVGKELGTSYDLGLDNKFLSNSRKNVILGKETSPKNMFFAEITGILWFDLKSYDVPNTFQLCGGILRTSKSSLNF